jgi:hypothetical protein
MFNTLMCTMQRLKEVSMCSRAPGHAFGLATSASPFVVSFCSRSFRSEASLTTCIDLLPVLYCPAQSLNARYGFLVSMTRAPIHTMMLCNSDLDNCDVPVAFDSSTVRETSLSAGYARYPSHEFAGCTPSIRVNGNIS